MPDKNKMTQRAIRLQYSLIVRGIYRTRLKAYNTKIISHEGGHASPLGLTFLSIPDTDWDQT